ncbi:uncharacterized protein AMSG_10779 [Thecamonas trahens ATCC 50062]|uniref:Uncharacterized protein n=1 Tax=Thecamonas trahens ATCC 50062 TaxID=461836 RepID=A0A0L0DUL6_THETB|nr:hypothetical protein AMSG_10779 [Thecamonas trahens ATCC 50062]KNC55168.1 hypothetical protein AMSG_10779 [Thecamonas trahens ATCC 50062]|eukprot:XP_013753221.1 hypothetical protein AMSG_10779 [Thecamonas trahens ATCC 50062]
MVNYLDAGAWAWAWAWSTQHDLSVYREDAKERERRRAAEAASRAALRSARRASVTPPSPRGPTPSTSSPTSSAASLPPSPGSSAVTSAWAPTSSPIQGGVRSAWSPPSSRKGPHSPGAGNHNHSLTLSPSPAAGPVAAWGAGSANGGQLRTTVVQREVLASASPRMYAPIVVTASPAAGRPGLSSPLRVTGSPSPTDHGRAANEAGSPAAPLRLPSIPPELDLAGVSAQLGDDGSGDETQPRNPGPTPRNDPESPNTARRLSFEEPTSDGGRRTSGGAPAGDAATVSAGSSSGNECEHAKSLLLLTQTLADHIADADRRSREEARLRTQLMDTIARQNSQITALNSALAQVLAKHDALDARLRALEPQ